MFEDFQPRHIPPLLLATVTTLSGIYPFVKGPEASLLKFGFPQHIASTKATHPVVTAFSSRVTSTGIALWGLYLGRQYRAMDVLFASMGWMALVDGWVCYKEGATRGSILYRVMSSGVVAVWGLLGMTNGESI